MQHMPDGLQYVCLVLACAYVFLFAVAFLTGKEQDRESLSKALAGTLTFGLFFGASIIIILQLLNR